MISPYLIAGIAGWIAAQGIKTVLALSQHPRERAVRLLYVSGGMPSAHSATVVALTTVIGLIEGINSAVFGVALTFSLVVMYDAMMVRRSSGRQGEIIVKILEDTKSTMQVPKFAKGHEPVEVLAGAVLGLVIGLVVYLITQS